MHTLITRRDAQCSRDAQCILGNDLKSTTRMAGEKSDVRVKCIAENTTQHFDPVQGFNQAGSGVKNHTTSSLSHTKNI